MHLGIKPKISSYILNCSNLFWREKIVWSIMYKKIIDFNRWLRRFYRVIINILIDSWFPQIICSSRNLGFISISIVISLAHVISFWSPSSLHFSKKNIERRIFNCSIITSIHIYFYCKFLLAEFTTNNISYQIVMLGQNLKFSSSYAAKHSTSFLTLESLLTSINFNIASIISGA